jgi:2-keto-3-deoxy-L-rhamnonate aldolase RhmA
LSRMFERLSNREPAIGLMIPSRGPEWLEIFGHVGLDFVCIDMQKSSIDWGPAADMIRYAKGFDLTPWIRLQAYPWRGQADSRVAADVLRALSIGAEAVTASASNADQVELLIDAARDIAPPMHLYTEYFRDAESLGEARDVHRQSTLVFPLLESAEAIDNIESIVQVPGLRAVFVGLGDLSRDLGYPGNDKHPEVRRALKHVVDVAKARDLVVISNTLKFTSDTPESIAESIGWLWDMGVNVLWIPYAPIAVQRFYQSVVDQARSSLAPHAP